ncbi:hypothetical protein [Kitasatospora sp. NPDC059160]
MSTTTAQPRSTKTAEHDSTTRGWALTGRDANRIDAGRPFARLIAGRP